MTTPSDDNIEWEEWDGKIPFFRHMLAGSIAGLVEHVSTFPVDTLKTYIQCERCGSNSPRQILLCANRIIKREGLLRLWRGVTAMFAGCIPAHAAYFSVYESMKIALELDSGGHNPINAAVCGASATFAHDMFMTPFDVIKQRMQLGYYSSTRECISKILRTEGIRSFYVSLPTTLVMNIPYGCVMVATNETVRKVLNPDGGFSLSTSLVAGSIAGAVAAAVTNPLDVIKTRLQTLNLRPVEVRMGQEYATRALNMKLSWATGKLSEFSSSNRSSQYRTAYQTFSHILKEEGSAGLMRGMLPRICAQAPAAAISWTAYETAKLGLSSYF